MNSFATVFAGVALSLALSHFASSLPLPDQGGAQPPPATTDVTASPDTEGRSDPNPIPSSATGAEEKKHGVGIGATVGTLGIGGQMAVALSPRFNLRGGGNFFRLTRTTSSNGISYNAGVHLGDVNAMLDWFPFAGNFHLSPGLLVYNGNNISGAATVPAGRAFTLNSVSYVSSPANPVTGTGTIGLNKVAPMFLVGWGNLVPRKKHLSISIEGGILYWGAPQIGLNLNGDVCNADLSHCRPIGTDPTVQANIKAQEAKYNSDASAYQVFPVITFGVGYRF